MRKCGSPRGLSALGGALVAACLLALGATRWVPGLIQAQIEERVREQVVWRPDSPPEVQKRFAPGPGEGPPVYARFYFFNITNLAGVHAGEKPILEEVGPYTYTKHREKRGVEFADGGREVKFHEFSYHLPCPELSAGAAEHAVVTTLNVPLAGALEEIGAAVPGSAATWVDLLASLVEGWRDERVSGVFTSRPVSELLWGYTDPLLEKLAWVVPGLEPTFRLVPNATVPADALRAVVDTGAGDLRDVWQYRRWRNLSAVTSWAPPHVEEVRGTDAFQFRPGLAVGDEVKVWASERYRAATLLARETVPPPAPGGPPLLRLRPDPRQGDPNPAYFQTIRGLMNVTSPTAAGPGGAAGKAGPPIFLSHPHFCGADPALAAGVTGLGCDPDRHELYIDVEPTTGITLRAAKRLMVSSWFGRRWAVVEPGARDTYLPIMWAEESAEATPEQLRQFAPLLRAQAAAAGVARFGGPVAGLLGLAGVALLLAAWVLAGRQEGEAWAESDEEAAGPAEASVAAILAGRAEAEMPHPERQPLLEASHHGEEEEEIGPESP